MEHNLRGQAPGISYEHKDRQSIKSVLVKVFLRATGSKGGLGKKFAANQLSREQLNKDKMPEPPKHLLEKFESSSWEVDGHKVFRLAPKKNKTKMHVLYLHGGSYVNTFTKYHWRLIERLIENYNCTMTCPDYPLAPEHTYKDTFKMVESVYKKLLDEVDIRFLVLMGDSAGGGLSLALAQKLKKENIPQPSNTILLSPWLDITCNNPEIQEVDKVDPMLGIESLKVAGKAYAGDLDPQNYLVSPINGDLDGIKTITLFIGTHDLLHPDCKKFKQICEEKHLEVNYFEYPKMIHDWMLVDMIPESQKAIEQIGAFLKVYNE